MDNEAQGKNSIILPSLPCEEQGAASSAFFKNENMKLKLTHRRSNSGSNNSPTGISASVNGNSPRKASSLSGNNLYFDTSTARNGSACICTKCHARITSLLSRSKPVHSHKAGPQPTLAGASNSVQVDPNPDNKDHEFFSCARAARTVLLCHHIIFKTTLNLITNWVYIKWVFRVLNLLIEIFQAILAQENGERRLSDLKYQKSCVMISFFCLIISLVEIVGEGKISQAVWQRKGYCCWFYYPGTERRLFGKFSLYFGIISSMIQFIINLTTLVIKRRFVKFDSLPLILSFGHLVVAIADPDEQFVVKCRIHGNCAVQCPHCEKDTSAS